MRKGHGEHERSNGRAVGSRGRRAVAGSAIIAGVLAGTGCEIDCDERYCDFIRAAAGGIYAWEYECCLDPTSPACENRAVRYQALAFNAPAMRIACEERRWERLGEIWDEIRGLIPATPLRLIVREFCGIETTFGENILVPFAAGDSAIVSARLDPVPFEGEPGFRSWSRRPSSMPASVEGVSGVVGDRAWVVEPGSQVQVDVQGRTFSFALSGSLAVVEMAAQPHARPNTQPNTQLGEPGDEVDEWCRRLRPTDLRFALDGLEGRATLVLDPLFEGNGLIFTAPASGVLGAAVRLEFEPAGVATGDVMSGLPPVFLQLPFVLEPDGGLVLGDGRAMAALDLWPVASAVASYLSGGGAGPGSTEPECAALARTVADDFLALHASECGHVP